MLLRFLVSIPSPLCSFCRLLVYAPLFSTSKLVLAARKYTSPHGILRPFGLGRTTFTFGLVVQSSPTPRYCILLLPTSLSYFLYRALDTSRRSPLDLRSSLLVCNRCSLLRSKQGWSIFDGLAKRRYNGLDGMFRPLGMALRRDCNDVAFY